MFRLLSENTPTQPLQWPKARNYPKSENVRKSPKLNWKIIIFLRDPNQNGGPEGPTLDLGRFRKKIFVHGLGSKIMVVWKQMNQVRILSGIFFCLSRSKGECWHFLKNWKRSERISNIKSFENCYDQWSFIICEKW